MKQDKQGGGVGSRVKPTIAGETTVTTGEGIAINVVPVVTVLEPFVGSSSSN